MQHIIVSILAIIILFFMSLLHILLLFGAPLGEFVLGGQNIIIPKNKRYINLIFSIIWILGIIIYGSVGGIFSFVSMNSLFIKILFYIFTAFWGITIFSNAFLTSSKKEKYVMVPSCLIMFLSSLFLLFT